MNRTTLEEVIAKVQSGEMNMLDFIMCQEELKEPFLADIKASGKTPEEISPEEATEWLTEYENNSLYKHIKR